MVDADILVHAGLSDEGAEAFVEPLRIPKPSNVYS